MLIKSLCASSICFLFFLSAYDSDQCSSHNKGTHLQADSNEALKYNSKEDDDLSRFLAETKHIDFNHAVFAETIAQIVTPDMNLEQKLEKLFYFTRDAVTFAPSASLKASEALKKGTAICYNKAMIYVSFCRRLGVPAALATEEFVIVASPKKSLHRHGIAKVHYDGRWHYIDTVSNREAWTYWHKEGAADFRPPAFSLEAHTVVGNDTISGLRFIDAETNDVPKEWLESLSRFQETGKW